MRPGDIGADAAVTVQLAQRWAVVAQAVLGEIIIVGQTDRAVAPWHHLASLARIVYAAEHAIDVMLEVHGDARDPRNQAGVAIALTRSKYFEVVVDHNRQGHQVRGDPTLDPRSLEVPITSAVDTDVRGSTACGTARRTT